jgi:hypothetical protein
LSAAIATGSSGGAAPPFSVCPPPLPLDLLWETFHKWLYQQGPPPPLEANSPPSDHLGSGKRPEKLHCLELPNALYKLGQFASIFLLDLNRSAVPSVPLNAKEAFEIFLFN